MKRAEQKEKRRLEIMKAALDIFVQKGYSGTKTIEIAKAVGMSEGLLFHYFPTKENLYYELVKNGVQGTQIFREPVEDAYSAFHEPLNDFLLQVKMDRSVAKMFVLMNHAQNKESTPEEVYKLASSVSVIHESVPLIKMGQKQGVFREGNPLTLAYTFWNALDGNMQELARNYEMDVPEGHWLMSILLSEKGTDYAK